MTAEVEKNLVHCLAEKGFVREENEKLERENAEIDAWVKRINAAARKLDADCEGIHPSAWPMQKIEEFKRMAMATPNAKGQAAAPQAQVACTDGLCASAQKETI